PGREDLLAIGLGRAPSRRLDEGSDDALRQIRMRLLEFLCDEESRVGAEDRRIALAGIDDLDDAALLQVEIFLAAERGIDIAGGEGGETVGSGQADELHVLLGQVM